MRRLIMVGLVIILAVSLGCSKKESEKDKSFRRAVTKPKTDIARKDVSSEDPVSKNPVDVREGSEFYSYEYKNVLYLFESKENMEKFKKDPEKYIGTQ